MKVSVNLSLELSTVRDLERVSAATKYTTSHIAQQILAAELRRKLKAIQRKEARDKQS